MVNKKGVNFFGNKVARRKGGSSTNHAVVSVDLFRTNLPYRALVLSMVQVYKKTCLLALLKYSCGSYSYVLAPAGLEVGSFIKTIFKPTEFSRKYQIGYLILLKYLAPHTIVFNLEIDALLGGKYAVAAGTYGIVLVVDFFTNQALLQLPTGKKIWVYAYCTGVLGRASNVDNNKKILGKAGMSRNYNLQPVVRGVAKNPVDHPHGGRTKTNSPEVTP